MEDPRLSRMYARILSGNLERARSRSTRWIAARRRGVMRLLALLVVVGAALAYYAHLHGQFRRLKVELRARDQQAEAPLLIGGQEPIVLSRTARGDTSFPEFLSATLLPGRGMSVLQITALIPGRGEVSLLQAPSLQAAARLLDAGDSNATRVQLLGMGGPVEVPWGGSVQGVVSGDGGAVTADWRGRLLSAPLTERRGDTGVSEGGLLLRSAADSVSRDVMPDGGSVEATYAAENLGGPWPSSIAVSTSVLLSGRAFEMRVQVRNDGREPTPVGVGWMPHFMVLSGDRRNALLRLPAEQQEQQVDGRATGRLTAVKGTPLDFTDRSGKRLGDVDLDGTFTTLRSGFLDNGPTVELRDPQSGVGLRLTAMSPQIRAIRVQSKAGENTVALGFQTNYDDPFRREWTGSGDEPILALQPGQTLRWRVRLEIMALASSEVPPL